VGLPILIVLLHSRPPPPVEPTWRELETERDAFVVPSGYGPRTDADRDGDVDCTAWGPRCDPKSAVVYVTYLPRSSGDAIRCATLSSSVERQWGPVQVEGSGASCVISARVAEYEGVVWLDDQGAITVRVRMLDA
jgi:hypothetical protein